ncbi:DUF6884 domain-containing protein [Natrinema gari]|uniref:DUF6884 domain-containing protein n=1 Tax=Natrinema gari JCM 14663 TaxID=1230459 RepID=L9ZCH2_9EURY|nr:DUF6884 domain-containing protein [Natrinema gari]ELY83317.1 hypothetical protein C486_03103 [Natrinema gari JCM 14663]
MFSKASQYCEQQHDDWYILSAKHHLLESDGPPIEPDDETRTGSRVGQKRDWSKEAFEQLESPGLLESDTVLVFHAGKAYYEELLPMLEETKVTVRFPVEGLIFGE